MKNPLLTTGLFALLMQVASAQGPSQTIADASSGAEAGSEALRLTHSNQQPDFEPLPEANQQQIAELAKLLRRHRSKHPAEQSDTQANLLYGIQGNEVTLVSRSHRLEGFTESELNHFLRFFGNLVEWPAQADEVEQAIIWTKAPAGGKPIGRPSDATLREVGRPSLRALFGQEVVKQLAEVRQRHRAAERLHRRVRQVEGAEVQRPEELQLRRHHVRPGVEADHVEQLARRDAFLRHRGCRFEQRGALGDERQAASFEQAEFGHA